MIKKLALVAAGTALLAGVGLSTATSAAAATSPMNCGMYSTSEPMLEYGDTGPSVKALQCELNTAMTNTHIAVDGIFGQQTYDAVIKFQGSGCADTGVDGIVGPKTWAALNFWSNYGGGYAC
ncbi:peptidoglycan-binding protein [Streptomyces sp. NPDC093089]|uniref:peptidoglycan-binding domain-containing protein n=1 Tax=Streptomyces sp. NPDC093089 TaxID=3366024 RepID=UPI00382595F8